MSHVKLTATDLDLIIEITQLIYDYKKQALSKLAWSKFENDYLPKLLEQIKLNEFVCNDYNNNCFTWLIDQIVWSHILTPGVPPKDGAPLSDSRIGEQALTILRAASKGQANYDSKSRTTTFSDLFE